MKSAKLVQSFYYLPKHIFTSFGLIFKLKRTPCISAAVYKRTSTFTLTQVCAFSKLSNVSCFGQCAKQTGEERKNNFDFINKKSTVMAEPIDKADKVEVTGQCEGVASQKETRFVGRTIVGGGEDEEQQEAVEEETVESLSPQKTEELDADSVMQANRKQDEIKMGFDDDDEMCLSGLFDKDCPAYQNVQKRLQVNQNTSWPRKRKGKGVKKGNEKEYLEKKMEASRQVKDDQVKKKRNNKFKGKRNSGLGEEQEEKNKLPNYFLAIRIDDDIICKEAEKFQDSVVEQESLFKHVLVNPSTLHITFLVMRIDNDHDMQNAKQALHEYSDELQKIYRQSTKGLVFKGLGNFGNKVVFMKIEDKSPVLESLQTMFQLLKESYDSKSIELSDNGEGRFKPHVTLMKMSKNFGRMRKNGIKKIDNKFTRNYEDHNFGTQTFSEILLCSMLDKKDSSGFYNVVDRLNLTGLEVIGETVAYKMDKEKEIDKMAELEEMDRIIEEEVVDMMVEEKQTNKTIEDYKTF
eukprot:gene15438-17014_t